MAEPRSFYGGEPLTGAAGGEIGAGKYDGPEAHVRAPWDCPACKAHNEGPLHLGCTACGAGKPGYHVGNPPPAQEIVDAGQPVQTKASPVEPGIVLEAWIRFWDRVAADSPVRALQAEDLLKDAFMAGWVQGAQNQARQTMNAAPVTADIRELAPHTKAQRTIIAALELFKDQVLIGATDEIASGEWCTVAEVTELIQRFTEQL